MANNFGFTTTARKARSDGVSGSSFPAATVAAFGNHEITAVKRLVDEAFRCLDLGNGSKYDTTATVSCSLTSGSIIQFAVTV